jgi:hypothetical protein
MNAQQPGIGDWYRLQDGELFEVIAVDEADGTVEVQYFDGTLEEMELEDWLAQSAGGVIKPAEPPEDYRGSIDAEDDDEGSGYDPRSDERQLNAGSSEDLDLFE